MQACEIRRMNLDDLDAVAAIEAATFPTPWSRHSFEQELTRNVAARYLVAVLDGQVIGYAGAVSYIHLDVYKRQPFAWPGRTVSCPSHCLRKTDRSLLCLRSVSLCVWHKSERLLYVHRWWRGKRNTPQASREVLYHTRICHGDLLHCAGQTFVIAHLDGAQ